jgi:hypothetical protein
LVLLIPSVSNAQYWGERSTERSFETSAFHFQSHFLNTYGLRHFRDVAPGLINDPFLNLHLNPANLPEISEGASLFYFDFRGDQDEAAIIEHYYHSPYDYLGYRPDPRWYSMTREEPEPAFSMGVLAYPLRESLQKLLLGGTYQVIFKEEPFYRLPTWIYRARYGYDAFGAIDAEAPQDVPIQDRYYGEDELSTEAHLFSVFTGYPASDRIDLGLGINTVTHTRDGSYVNLRTDEYGQTNDWDWETLQERSRAQDYHHFDINGGIRSELGDGWSAALKIGRLSGNADQSYASTSSYRYSRGDSLQDENWYNSQSSSATLQEWERDGNAWYGNLSIELEMEDGKRLAGYYRLRKSELDLTNASSIEGGGRYDSEYWYNHDHHKRDYHGRWTMSDTRHGEGQRDQRTREGRFSFAWDFSPKMSVCIAPQYKLDRVELRSSEPVTADRRSWYYSFRNDTLRYAHDYRLSEIKRLEWSYDSERRTIQMPVVLTLRAHEHLKLLLGVNKRLDRWEISDETTAYFTERSRTENGTIKTESDFGERYTLPVRRITEEHTALLSSAEVILSPQFQVRLSLDPETEDVLKINQWWLSFQLQL